MFDQIGTGKIFLLNCKSWPQFRNPRITRIYVVTCVSGRRMDKDADSKAENANMLIGILGDTSASLPTVVASTWK